MNRSVFARTAARDGLTAVAFFVLGCAGQSPPLPPVPPGDAVEGHQPAEETPASPPLLEVRRNPGAAGNVVPLGPREMVAFDPILTSSAVRDEEIQERIDWWLEYWRTRSSAPFQRGLVRMGRYEDYIIGELAERDLPPSLVYLPLIEANYYPTAVSRAGAAGLWQFMPRTARWLGLRVDAIVDERFDPFTATPAALDYILDLNEQFGSWFLTLAAYNAGPGRVEAAIRQYGGGSPRDDALFARIRERLPSETRNFIPKYIAAVRIASVPSYYGLPDPVKAAPLRFDVADVEGAATIDVIARAAGVGEEEAALMNPHLRAGITAVRGTTRVHLPEGRARDFAERFAMIPPRERVTRHIVSAGETMTHIARNYGISVDELRAANPRAEPRFLQIGAALVIPARDRTRSAGARTAAGEGGVTDEGSGDAETLSRGGVRSSPGDRSAAGSESPPGSPPASAETVHVFRQMDSLWLIARMYGVDLLRLRIYNRLGADAPVQPGDTIRIPPST